MLIYILWVFPLANLILICYYLKHFFASTFVYNFITMYLWLHHTYWLYYCSPFLSLFPFCFIPHIFFLFSFLIWLSHLYLLLHSIPAKLVSFCIFSGWAYILKGIVISHRNTHIWSYFTIYFIKRHQISTCIFVIFFHSKVPSLNPYLCWLIILSFQFVINITSLSCLHSVVLILSSVSWLAIYYLLP